MFKRRLIEDFHLAWEWGSIRFIALGALLQATLLAFPPPLRHWLPDWVLQYGALFCLAAAAYARVTTKKAP